MANVLFKRGSQSALDTIRTNKSAIEGAFYLTEDSHRLYVGTADKDAVPVNEGITTVTTIQDLPDPSGMTSQEKALMAGQFYYISGTTSTPVNILAVFNGQSWIQINASNDTSITKIKEEISVSGSTATIKETITDSAGTNHNGSFKITVAGGLTLTVNTAKDTLTIDASALKQNLGYTIDDYGVDVKLSNPSTSGNKFRIEEGNTNITIEENSAKTGIKISAKDTKLTQTGSGFVNNGSNGFKLTVKDTAGTTVTGTLDPVIRINGDASTDTHFETGIADLPVYSKDEIDEKMKGVDAMTYKGTIGDGGTGHNGTSTPTTNVKIGDTYKVITKNVVSGAAVGDVIIARPKDNTVVEDANGYLPSTGIVWDLITSGNEDTTYKGYATANGMSLKSNVDNSVVAAFTVAGDNTYVTVSDSASDGAASNTVTVKHKTVTAKDDDTVNVKQTANSSDTYVQSTLTHTFTKNVIKDAAGHVSGIIPAAVVMNDTNATLDSAMTMGVSATANVATVDMTTTLRQSSGRTKTAKGTFKLASTNDNLEITADDTTDTITMSLVWDNFT